MGFNCPSWAAQPERLASLEVLSSSTTYPVDSKPFYLFGREQNLCDIVVDDPSVSRQHAALVHHKDQRVFLIDLASSHGTTLDSQQLPANKPILVTNGSRFTLGTGNSTLVLHCDTGGEKRKAGADMSSNKKQKASTVRASHLLVKHRDSRNPSSWKEERVTRTREEALAMVQAFRARLVNKEVDFPTLAAAESHCSSARRGGDLGEFSAGAMQPAFEQAAFALQVGELSQPVVSDSGVHLILRTG